MPTHLCASHHLWRFVALAALLVTSSFPARATVNPGAPEPSREAFVASGALDCVINPVILSERSWLGAFATPGASQLWSDPATWGGQLPRAGADVLIPTGQHIVLDVSTPALGGIRVEGTLSFADAPVDLTADWILVNGRTARFEIGAPNAPYRHKATITLTADDPNENVAGSGPMSMGTKFLATMNGGSVAIHGHRRDAVSWTVLDAHVRPGDRELRLADRVDWRPGDEIVIAPSGFSPFEAEQRTIARVDGRTVTLTEPLDYRHFGEIQTIEGRAIDMRAEVGLLTRDIVIQGDENSLTRVDETGYEVGFGGHLMFMVGGTAQIEGVELVRMGQTGKKGRYPIHWHFTGDRPSDYARGNSVHHSYQRAIAMHRAQRVTVENNVAYHVTDHMYVFAEDGEEFDNRFIGNLGILNWAKQPRDFAFPHRSNYELSAQGEERAGIFWGRNPHNELRNNRAAGSYRGHGYFFDQQYMSSFTTLTRYLHRDQPIAFTGNVAHSIYETPGLGSHASYGPKVHGAGLMIGMRDGPYPLEFGPDFLAYKVSHSGVWIEEENETIVGAVVTDSGIGVSQTFGRIRDLFVAGNTANDIGGAIPATARHARSAGGVNITDQTQKKSHENLRRVSIDGATFVNVEPAAITVEWRKLEPGSETSGLRFVNTTPLFFFNKMHYGGIYDADGSLSGTNRAGMIYGEGDDDAAISFCDWMTTGFFCPDDGTLATPTPSTSLANAQPGVAYKFWSGTFLELPRADTLGIASGNGVATYFDLDALPVLSGHAVTYEGYLSVPTTGTYRFVLDAKEGGTLSIGDEVVIQGNRPGQPEVREGYVRLAAGFHAIDVQHYKKLSNPKLSVKWEGPGFGLRVIQNADLARGTSAGGGSTDGGGTGGGGEEPPPANAAPMVELTSPRDGDRLSAGRSVTLRVAASDPDGSVTKVTFLVDGQPIGEDTSAPFSVRVRRAPAGVYTLSAIATDDQGATTTSAAATVTVGNGARVASASNTADAWAIDTDSALPEQLGVDGFYPNPFTATTEARVLLADDGDYEVAIYDVTGRLIQQLLYPGMAAGTLAVRVDLSDQASGVYVLQARHLTTGATASAQMTLVR
ncbi:MAG: G8 domain-containing protein [Bacteroidota bacterium]